MKRSAKLQLLVGAGAAALCAAMGTAAATTITIEQVNSYTGSNAPAAPAGFTPIALPGSGSNMLVTSSTITTVPGISSIAFNASSNPASGEYAGNTSGIASPYGSGNGSNLFLAAGGENNSTAGSVTVTYATPQTSLYILWGTVDSQTNPDRNLVDISAGAATIGGNTIGADVCSADPGACPFGFPSGTLDVYVLISGLPSFTSAVFSDASTASFEFNLGQPTATPLPAALPLFAAGLGVMGLLGRRRKQKAALPA
jgi:hypothetical protein